MSGRHVMIRSTGTPFGQTIDAGPHQLLADEPVEFGGADTGPNPYEYLLAALGSCTSMTILLYARRKQWPLQQVTVELSHARIHRDDCEQCPTEERRLDRIEQQLTLTGPLTAEQRQRLLEIAERCPVHQTLIGQFEVRTALVAAS